MQFKLDENLPPSAAELLRSLGHDVMTVYDQGLQNCIDPEVLAACQGEGKILLSLDLDFSNILVFPPERYAGLIVLRLHRSMTSHAPKAGGPACCMRSITSSAKPPVRRRERIAELLDTLKMGGDTSDQFEAVLDGDSSNHRVGQADALAGAVQITWVSDFVHRHRLDPPWPASRLPSCAREAERSGRRGRDNHAARSRRATRGKFQRWSAGPAGPRD